ncbi:hypothetical protein F53441_9823 [Fusarium austroafricanum]|uniref:Uncharacterized protein n=1 Tax=Fusarium austroafricanum TaxID=2364996 RepID=A0A8H4NPV3_9HYPO|nr:hypothetical protein F53441_9823 [Fusarium austroafricanum]
MPFPDLSTLKPLPKSNGRPVGTKGKEQGSSTFKHMPTREHGPSCPGNIPTNPVSTAVDVEDCTDHAQSHRGTGDQSEDVNKTGLDPEFYPEGEITGSPTESNSPTRYEVYTSPREFPPSLRRSFRARKLTRKAQEIEDMVLPTRKVRGSSHKIQKKPSKRSKQLRQENDVAKLVLEASSSFAPSRNRFVDSDGDLIFPTIQQFYEMKDSDKEEWQWARSLF